MLLSTHLILLINLITHTVAALTHFLLSALMGCSALPQPPSLQALIAFPEASAHVWFIWFLCIKILQFTMCTQVIKLVLMFMQWTCQLATADIPLWIYDGVVKTSVRSSLFWTGIALLVPCWDSSSSMDASTDLWTKGNVEIQVCQTVSISNCLQRGCVVHEREKKRERETALHASTLKQNCIILKDFNQGPIFHKLDWVYVSVIIVESVSINWNSSATTGKRNS